jgi:hypothetical protein
MCFDKMEEANPTHKLDPLHHARKAAGFNSFSSNAAAREAQAAAERMEAERQARITKNVGNINSAFAGRGAQYKRFSDALRSRFTGELTRQHADAGRNLKFELAGAGLTGGSVAADSGRDLARQMTEGTISSESKVNAAEADLRSRDEQTRSQMIAMAQAGGDIGNASAQTASMLRGNIGAAEGTNTANALGDMFGRTRNIRRGLKQSEIYASPFTRGSGAGGP